MPDLNPEPLASLGGHGNDHFTVRHYIPAANCVVQLQRTSFLTAVKVVSTKDSR